MTWLLRLLFRFSAKSRLAMITQVINSEGLSIRSIIATDENRRILVNNKPLSIEQTVQLQESAYALSQNQALRLIRDQVRHYAIEYGYLKNGTADLYQEMFYKAALWYAQEEEQLINSLAAKDQAL